MSLRPIAVLFAGIAAVALPVLPAPSLRAQQGNGHTHVLLDQLLFDIRNTLIRVRNDTDGALVLRHAALELSTVLEKSASGGLNLVVVTFGGTTGSGTTQTLNMKLQPPLPGDPLPVHGASDALADAIVQAYRAARSAATSDPPLRMTELETAIKFVVSTEGSGGASFSILPISAEIGGTISQSDVHSISLAFCNAPCP